MENVTAVIPFFNGHRYIERLLKSLPEDLPVIIVDDHSDDPLHLNNRKVTVIRPDKKGFFSGAVNAGIDACYTDVLVLNQDIWFKGTEWIDFIEDNRDEYGLLGDGVMGHPAWPKGYVQGTFMFMRRDAINKTGLLDVEHYPFWGATAEWQMRMCRRGFKALPVKPVPGMKHARDDEKNDFGSAITTILNRNPDKRGHLIRTPPMISVIVPCFNHGRYLSDLINSLIGGETSLGYFEPQTFQSFEIVIVDDASTDNTSEYLDELEDPWKGIKVIRQLVNGGTAISINAGVKSSRSKFITRIDADDMMESERLEKMYLALLEDESRVVYDDMRIFADEKRSRYWPMKTYDFDLLLMKNHIHAGIMLSRKAWEDVGGYPEIMNRGREDWAFNVALGVKGWCGHHLDYAGYLYRREGQNRTLRNTNPYDRAKFLDQMISLFPTIYAGDRPTMCCGPRGENQMAKKQAARRQIPNALPGSEGMLLVEYIGGKHGTMRFDGPVTNTPYLFGGNRKVGYVDDRDALEMVGMLINRRQVFKYFKSPKAKVSQRDTVAVKVDGSPEAVPIDVTVEKDLIADPGGMSIGDLRNFLGGLETTPEELEKMLTAEIAGKDRKGAKEALKEALANID